MKKRNQIIVLIMIVMALVFTMPTIASAREQTAVNQAGGSPIYINYQGQLLDSSGGAYVNVTLAMDFELFGTQTGGSYDWQETHPAVQTDADGRFNVILNSTGLAVGNLATLIQQNSELWLQITVDGQVLTPRQRLTSSAYALSAPWSGISGMPTGFADGIDDYGIAGTGMSATGSIMSISPAYRLPQNCTNGQVAEWDNTSNVWICANDDGGSATYTASDGLTLTNSEFELSFTTGGAGTLNGSTNTAARSDHTHITQSWDASTENGLAVSSDKGTTGSFALKGVNTSTIGAVYGVYGESSSTSGFGVYGKNTATGGFGVYSNGDAKVVGDLVVTGAISSIVITPPKTVTNHLYLTPADFNRSPLGSGFTINAIYDNPDPTPDTIVYNVALAPKQGDPNTGAYFYAPVNLPHGAIIKKLTYTYSVLTSTAPDNFSFELIAANNTTLAQTSIGLFSNYNVEEIDLPINASHVVGNLSLVVDNSAYNYSFSFSTVEVKSWILHSVDIEYTLTTP